MEKHRFLDETEPKLQDMVRMFKEEELLSPEDSSNYSMIQKYCRMKSARKSSSSEAQTRKTKCLEITCLVSGATCVYAQYIYIYIYIITIK